MHFFETWRLKQLLNFYMNEEVKTCFCNLQLLKSLPTKCWQRKNNTFLHRNFKKFKTEADGPNFFYSNRL